MLSKIILPFATALIFSGCSYLSFSKIKNYNTKKIADLIELAAEKNIAKIEENFKDSTLSNYVRIMTIDLNPLDDQDPKQKGMHEKDSPHLYNIFGIDQIKYIDAGKKGYSKEDTLITSFSCKHPDKSIVADFSIKDAKEYKNGMPLMNRKFEILYFDGNRKWAIKDTCAKKVVSPHEEYYRFVKKTENFLENKIKKK